MVGGDCSTRINHDDLAAARFDAVDLCELIRACEKRTARGLRIAADPKLSGSQISRFLVLPKELDADDGELTRTRKVRRNFIAERYGVLIEALYNGTKSCHIETVVKYEDGRSGRIEADVEIRDAKTFAPAKKAA